MKKLLAVVLLLSGCATMDRLSGITRKPSKSTRQAWVDTHKTKFKAAILEGLPEVGMSDVELRVAVGEPCRWSLIQPGNVEIFTYGVLDIQFDDQCYGITVLVKEGTVTAVKY